MASLMTLATLFLILILATHVPVQANNDETRRYLRSASDVQKPLDLVGFWHIGESSGHEQESRDSFVMKQGQEILSSYLFNEGLNTGDYNLKLNYVTTAHLSDETKTFLGQSGIIHEHPPKLLPREEGVEYFEYPTLVELHAFCQEPENTDAIAFYMNSKSNDQFRMEFENYLLGDSCVQCMKNDEKQACGPWYTGTDSFYWKHFSGNFWMAKCSHVALLNTPFYNEVLTEGHDPNFYPPKGRMFAQYWLMNDAGPRPEHTQDITQASQGLLSRQQVCSDRWRMTNEPGDDEQSGQVVHFPDREEVGESGSKIMKDTDLLQWMWKGRHYSWRKELSNQHIHVVVAFCHGDLGWLTDYTRGFQISSIHIVSKCDQPITDLPPHATVEVVPNVGGNDHTYAHYITNILDKKIFETYSDPENSVVVFVKDNNGLHQPHFHFNTFEDMLTIASSSRGFGCSLISDGHLSAYHHRDLLYTFRMPFYQREGYDAASEVPFQSGYPNLGEFLKAKNLNADESLTHVCFGGNFAASVANIKKTEETTWVGLERTLSRGNNIEEGHFMERTWASILATPLSEEDMQTLYDFSDLMHPGSCCYQGALKKISYQ